MSSQKILIFIAVILMVCLWPSCSLCAEIVPPIDSLMFADKIVSAKYQRAAAEAQKAFVVQFGIKGDYDQIRNKANRAASEIENKIVIKLLSAMGDISEKEKEYMIFAIGGTYTVLVKKNIEKTFNSPLSRHMQHYVKWSPDATELGVIYHF